MSADRVVFGDAALAVVHEFLVAACGAVHAWRLQLEGVSRGQDLTPEITVRHVTERLMVLEGRLAVSAESLRVLLEAGPSS